MSRIAMSPLWWRRVPLLALPLKASVSTNNHSSESSSFHGSSFPVAQVVTRHTSSQMQWRLLLYESIPLGDAS
jgi:hypothetical protein